MKIDPAFIPIWFVIFLLSLSIHEAAHAWTAERFGDPTGRYSGRVTLNPMAHIDIIGTIIFPLMSLVTGAMFFGWAKPVPVDLSQMKDRKWGDICVSLAGPVSNIILAIFFFVAMKVVFLSPGLQASMGEWQQPIIRTLFTGLSMNVVLAVFNLLPIPPLDGSHVLQNLLPARAAEAFETIRPYGFVILIGLMMTGVTGKIINPIFDVVMRGIVG
ncbi:MAG: site-2 protease family protein [Blastocatellia bacterium]|nr:site-2 protease family protein [Blastocatellia bacterium]